MEFYQITEDTKATPGEYIYHAPTKQVVMCGSFSRLRNSIRVLARGRMFVDKIENFRKIRLNKKEREHLHCKGCAK